MLTTASWLFCWLLFINSCRHINPNRFVEQSHIPCKHLKINFDCWNRNLSRSVNHIWSAKKESISLFSDLTLKLKFQLIQYRNFAPQSPLNGKKLRIGVLGCIFLIFFHTDGHLNFFLSYKILVRLRKSCVHSLHMFSISITHHWTNG